MAAIVASMALRQLLASLPLKRRRAIAVRAQFGPLALFPRHPLLAWGSMGGTPMQWTPRASAGEGGIQELLPHMPTATHACCCTQVLVIAGGAALTSRQVLGMVKHARAEQQQLIGETFTRSNGTTAAAAGGGEEEEGPQGVSAGGGAAPSTSGRGGAHAPPRIAVNAHFLRRLLRILSM